MKKSLIVTLALVFVLGIAGTALAANPFVDVPANHWAYASVAKLAQAGIIDGYGDGTYVGSNTMTRYEMAQIVAKALARSDRADASLKAQIEKLAAEFADELDSLGVRVAKLEKNADNVKITGEARFSHYNYKNDLADHDNSTLRTRLWLSGQVNDRWKFVGMMEHNGHNLQTNASDNDAADGNNLRLRRAYVDGMIGDINVQAGRYFYAPVFGTVLDADGDGIKLSYRKNNLVFDLFAMRPDIRNASNLAVIPDDTGNVQVFGGVIGYDMSKRFTGEFAFYNVNSKGTDLYDGNIMEVGLKYTFSQKFSIWGNYLRGDDFDRGFKKNGYAAGLIFSTIDREKSGSFELRGSYYSVPAGASINTTPELDITPLGEGYKGWTVGASWMVAKNIDVNVDYFDFKTKEGANQKEKLLWSYVRFYF